MYIEFDYKYFDHLIFQIMHNFRNVRTHILYSMLTLFFTAASVKDKGILAAIIFFILFYVFIWTMLILITFIFTISKNNKALLTAHKISINNEELIEETAFGKASKKWSAFYTLITIPGYVVIYINYNSAHVIPNRAFKSKNERKEFISNVKNKIKSA